MAPGSLKVKIVQKLNNVILVELFTGTNTDILRYQYQDVDV